MADMDSLAKYLLLTSIDLDIPVSEALVRLTGITMSKPKDDPLYVYGIDYVTRYDREIPKMLNKDLH